MLTKLGVAIAVMVLVLGGSAAKAAAGRGHGGGHMGGGHGGHFEHHGGNFRGHEHFFVGPRVFIGAPFWWYTPYAYVPAYVDPPQVYAQPAPSYWYYCPSAGAYYPYVSSCPEGWLQVVPR